MISNRIIKGIMDEFKSDFQFGNDDESKAFEKLVNYIVLSKHDPDAFSDSAVFDLIDVDKKSTFGIDTFALIINDNLITQKSEIDAHRKIKRLDVKFIFIQTKTSQSIDSGDFLKFTTAVKNFFSENPSIVLSEELQIAKDIVDEVFKPDNARHFANRKPKCELYYATSGARSSDQTILGLFAQEEKNLCATIPEVESFTVRQVDADYIIDSYSEIENTFSVIIDFEKNISCKKINYVEQSYIGYLPVSEFLKLITGTDGHIRKNLFYENVRDFQGADNPVNNEIAETINNPDLIDKFILLNNGVTIVSREFTNLRSNEYELRDYYIVNGCQTSNVIYTHRATLNEGSDLSVPVKIIHTKSSELISMLIRSTNRQTPVPDEAFVSLEKFHKRLQEYYRITSLSAPEKLYYERRSREFSNSDERIERPRIISLHALIRSFASVILGEPQLVMSNNPNSILKEHSSKLFVEGQSYAPYYLSSMLLFMFYKLQHENIIQNKYALSRHWICWIFYILILNNLEPNPLNSKKYEKECENIFELLKDTSNTIRLFRKSIGIFEDARSSYIQLNGPIQNNHLVRLRALRDIVKDKLIQEINQGKPTKQSSGHAKGTRR